MTVDAGTSSERTIERGPRTPPHRYGAPRTTPIVREKA